VWPPVAAESKGWQNECFKWGKKKKILGSTNFTLLIQVKANSMNDCDLF